VNGICCDEGRRCCAHNADCELNEICDDLCHCCTERAVHSEKTLTKVEVCEIEGGDAQYCYQEVAIEELDGNLCDRIDDDEERDQCFLNIAKERSTGCPKPPLPPGVEACFIDVVQDKNAFVVCDNIISDDLRDKCFLLIFDNQPVAAICDRIVGKVRRNGCLTQLANYMKDAAVCDKVDDLDYRDRCLLDVAETMNYTDVTVCERFTAERERNICYGHVVNVTSIRGDSATCESITVDKYRELCLADVAPTMKSTDVCDQITSEDMRDRCLSGVAPVVEDVSICENIQSDEPPYNYRSNCFIEVAHATEDKSICVSLEDADERAVCEAFSTQDHTVCDNSTTELRADKCRWLTARRFNNTEICNIILDNDYRYKCLRDVFWWDQS
jgi:hypothetical protein